jgi:hypothetical protein
LLPVFFRILGVVYRAYGLRSFLAAGGLYFVAVALALLLAAKAPDHEGSAPSLIAAAIVLIAGGAIEWFAGSAGPPKVAQPAALYLNSVGLLAGWIVVLAGLAVLTASTWTVADRALSLLGLVGFTLATALWTAERVTLWATMALVTAHSGAAPADSDVMTALDSARSSLWIAAEMMAYLALAAFAVAMWKYGLGKIWRTVVICLAVLLAARLAISGIPILVLHSTRPFVFLPPAAVCLLPYFIGVALLQVRKPNVT